MKITGRRRCGETCVVIFSNSLYVELLYLNIPTFRMVYHILLVSFAFLMKYSLAVFLCEHFCEQESELFKLCQLNIYLKPKTWGFKKQMEIMTISEVKIFIYRSIISYMSELTITVVTFTENIK